MMADTNEARQIALSLEPLEREWITGWTGPSGAAFNVIASGLRHKGLLVSASDWSLNALGLAVREILENE